MDAFKVAVDVTKVERFIELKLLTRIALERKVMATGYVEIELKVHDITSICIRFVLLN